MYLDLERAGNATGIVDGTAGLEAYARECIKIITAAGYKCGVYTSPACITQYKLDNFIKELAKADPLIVWIAAWTDNPETESKYKYGQGVWQWGGYKYVGGAYLPGKTSVNGEVVLDGNVMYVETDASVPVTPAEPPETVKPPKDTASSGVKIENGSVVEIKPDSKTYYPESEPVPAWVVNDFYHIVTQTTVNGKTAIKGGVICVLLGKKVEKTRFTESEGINTWIAVDSLTIIRKA